MEKNKCIERELWIDFLRVILTFLVVIGHSTYYNIDTLFGGIHYGKMMSENSITDSSVHYTFGILVNWIYTFHMPAFFAISGVLFGGELKKNKYPSLGNLVVNKAKRLLLPLIVIWFVYNIPIKLLTGYYEGVKPFGILLQIIFCKDVSFWFLESLFFSFIIVYEIYRYVKKEIWQLFILIALCFFGVYFQKKYAYYVPFGNPIKYSIWLWIGIHTCTLEEWLRKKKMWNPVGIIIIFLLESALYLLQRHDLIPLRTLSNITIKPLMMYIILVYLSKIAVSYINDDRTNGKLMKVSSYSFGIYLYADTLNYLILYLFYKSGGIECFGNYSVSAIIIVLRIIITTVIACSIIYILRICKIHYFG